MDIFYSATTGGFYSREIHGDNIPEDAVGGITQEEHFALMDGQSAGKLIIPGAHGCPMLADPPPLTREQRIKAMESEVQIHLDAEPRKYGYDDIRSAVTYADEPSVPEFQVQGQAYRAWRSLVWKRCYEILAQVDAGIITEPSATELIAMLPAAPSFT